MYEQAPKVEGLANEITLIRTLIRLVLLRTTPDLNQFTRAFTCLERLCKTHKKVFWSQEDDLEKIRERTIAIFEGINVPADFIRKKLQ